MSALGLPQLAVAPDLATPPPNFDRVARLYRWGEYLALGPLLQRARTSLLPMLGDRHHALVLGDGDGRFSARLLRRYPALSLRAIDSSRAMLDLLSRRCLPAAQPAATRLTVQHADARQVSCDRRTDLVVTHFLLDCLTQCEVEQLMQRLAARLQPGTLWLVSEFAIPQAPVLRTMGAVYIRALYLAFRLLTGLRVQALPEPGVALAAAGFVRRHRREFLCGLLYSELWELAPGA